MDDAPPHRLRWPRVLGRVGGYTLLAVVLYVLGTGLAIYFFDQRSRRFDPFLETVCTPLILLAVHTETVGPLGSYWHWWQTLPGGPFDRVRRQSIPLPAVQEPSIAEPVP